MVSVSMFSDACLSAFTLPHAFPFSSLCTFPTCACLPFPATCHLPFTSLLPTFFLPACPASHMPALALPSLTMSLSFSPYLPACEGKEEGREREGFCPFSICLEKCLSSPCMCACTYMCHVLSQLHYGHFGGIFRDRWSCKPRSLTGTHDNGNGWDY